MVVLVLSERVIHRNSQNDGPLPSAFPTAASTDEKTQEV